jgi:uncharacterized protein (TIGR02611 family)
VESVRTRDDKDQSCVGHFFRLGLLTLRLPEGVVSISTWGGSSITLASARNLRLVGQDETGGRPPLIERVRARRDRHKERSRLFRIGFALLGFLVCAAGLVMLVTPGPGIPVLILGLAMLALEFAWAERWLERVVDKAEEAVDQVTKGSPARQAALISAGLVGLVAIVVAVILWDIPFFPG